MVPSVCRWERVTRSAKALRKALFKYKLHADDELFEKAFQYVRQYY